MKGKKLKADRYKDVGRKKNPPTENKHVIRIYVRGFDIEAVTGMQMSDNKEENKLIVNAYQSSLQRELNLRYKKST